MKTDLIQILHDRLDKTITEKWMPLIDKHLERTLDEITRDLLKDWGEFGKDLKDQIQTSMKISLDREKIETYNARVNQIVMQKLNSKVDTSITQSITETIDRAVCLLEKDTWNLSDILTEFVKWERLDKDGGCELTVIVEESNYGSLYIYFDEKSDERSFNCKHMFSLEKKDGKIWNYTNRERRNNWPTVSHFDQFCFALYTQRVKIVVDNYKTEYYRGDY